MRVIPRLGLLAAILLLTGCDEPFEPFMPSEMAFSIYGTLEASADTQWIRVRGLQDSPEVSEGPIDAVVTLEEIETGTKVQMTDSIFTFETRDGEISISVHLFYTTHPIVPGYHYRVTATRSDGATATGTTLIPEFDTPVDMMFFTDVTVVPRGVVHGVEHIAMAFGDTEIPAECDYFAPIYREFLRVDAAQPGSGPPRVWLAGNAAPRDYSMEPPGCNPNRWGEKRITIIASGEAWPWPRDFRITLRELLHPSTVNTIENGVGFLAGTFRRVFPYEPCIAVDGVSCTVSYHPRSARLVGKVVDSCAGTPVAGANVRLLQSDGNAIRGASTDGQGRFSIQGLNPGRPHSLTLDLTGYLDYAADPLTFDDAAADTLSFVMTKGVCS